MDLTTKILMVVAGVVALVLITSIHVFMVPDDSPDLQKRAPEPEDDSPERRDGNS